MKVALVHDFLLRYGGAERVLKTLMDMYPDAPVYTLLYDKKKMGEEFPAERVVTSKLQRFPRFLPGMHKFLFPFMPSAIEQFDFSGFDVVISSNSAYAHGIVTNLDTTHICYYHSPMRYAWDYTHKYLKEQNLGGIGELLASRLMHKVRMWDFLAADRVDVPIANSKTVRNRIKKYYRQDAEIIHPPVDTERFEPHELHEGYFLIVSTLTPYKKIDLAVELFNKLGKRLVIIGDGPDKARLQRMAASNIDFLGFKPDDVVNEYFENCRAFIFPGEEDFGIAPVEAMACGKPVLGFNKGGLSESMIPGETGELFAEQTLESMEAALTQLLINEKNYSAKKISEHAKQYSKKAFKKAMKSLVERVNIEHQ
ncbi:glycosyltransferase [Candidatus Peregrinibacteria bacterium]|jgi:glycosyltransferase involved in cell wall biosynthesis|nr:glycosyltransferase [Candidatus Peregrinibacteria bacterium]MBT5823743.1 glycosyltransferase [Candidatus Peregrinibacteria bacterium]